MTPFAIDFVFKGRKALLAWRWDAHIDLWNDGGLPFDMTIEKLMGQHRSKPRNTNIASVLYKAGFIESWGRGISKITDGFAAVGLKAPEFKEDCGGILVTLYRNTNLANGLSSVESAEEVPKSAEEGDLRDNPRRNQGETNEKTGEKTKEKTRDKIIKLIKENPNITQKEMQEKLHLSKVE